MDCVDPKQQPFVLMRNCQVTGQDGGDTRFFPYGTFRVTLSTHSAHKQRPHEELKLEELSSRPSCRGVVNKHMTTFSQDTRGLIKNQ